VIRLDPSSAVPPYEQVRSQLAGRIADGALPPGTRLPPVRRLAEDLGLAANTVARAYRELEEAGLVETHGRGGTLVAAGDGPRRQVQEAARAFAELAGRHGLRPEEALGYVRAAFDAR
jgi:DNA-binding transcriptional regulator YhcF (GntR family)